MRAAAAAPAVVVALHAEQRMGQLEYPWDASLLVSPGSSLAAATIDMAQHTAVARASHDVDPGTPEERQHPPSGPTTAEQPTTSGNISGDGSPSLQEQKPTSPTVAARTATLSISESVACVSRPLNPQQLASLCKASPAVCDSNVADRLLGGGMQPVNSRCWSNSHELQCPAPKPALKSRPCPPHPEHPQPQKTAGLSLATLVLGGTNAVLAAALACVLLLRRSTTCSKGPQVANTASAEQQQHLNDQHQAAAQPHVLPYQRSYPPAPLGTQLDLQQQQQQQQHQLHPATAYAAQPAAVPPAPAAAPEEKEEDFFPFNGYGVSKPTAHPAAAGGGGTTTAAAALMRRSAAALSGCMRSVRAAAAAAAGVPLQQQEGGAPALLSLGPQLAGSGDVLAAQPPHKWEEAAGSTEHEASSPSASWLTASARKAGRWTRDVAGRLIRASQMAAAAAAAAAGEQTAVAAGADGTGQAAEGVRESAA